MMKLCVLQFDTSRGWHLLDILATLRRGAAGLRVLLHVVVYLAFEDLLEWHVLLVVSVAVRKALQYLQKTAF